MCCEGRARMRSPRLLRSVPMSRAVGFLGFLLLLAGCFGGDPSSEVAKSSPDVRAERRAFDGAPPVIPHERFDSPCVSCHDEEGVMVAAVGFSPPSPHAATLGLADGRCRQCHVERLSEELFRANSFQGLPQDLRAGDRQHLAAPPVMPHSVFLRENCLACHSGPAAREAIRTSHPERTRCSQCHLEQRLVGDFPSTPQS